MSRWRRFVLITFVLNTVLFTIAKFSNTPIWQVITVEFILFGFYIFYRAWSSKSQKLANQASSLGWSHIGFLTSQNGYKENLFSKGLVKARISYDEGCIYTLEPFEMCFQDFKEVEEHFGSFLIVRK